MGTSTSGGFDFGPLQARLDEILPDALRDGMAVIREDAIARAPKEHGDLSESTVVEVIPDYGGVTVSLRFAVPWARKEHEHLYYHHPQGGEPKFEETALLTKGSEAVEIIADRIREAL